MRTKVDAAFRAQASKFGLRFCCEDCAYFDLELERCSHGYPTEEHRRADLAQRQLVVFCKDFELT